MAKGNVGDRILVVDQDSGDGAYMNGHRGTICLVEEGFGGANVHFDHLEKQGGGEYLYAEEYEIIEQAPKESLEQSIPWAVGQEVWDLREGKGKVIEIKEGEDYPVFVEFENEEYATYSTDGKFYTGDRIRSLFFSEPQVIADTMPPKKPFIPTFKQGDQVLIIGNNSYPEGKVFTVYSELEYKFILSNEARMFFMKKDIRSVQLLGDKVEFNV